MGRRGAVVCAEPLAAQVGAEVLRRGGNAMDAALAASIAEGVVNPPLCGIGGSGVLNAFAAGTGKSLILDFWGVAGSRATPAAFAGDVLVQGGAVTGYRTRGERNKAGYQSVMVPGFVRGIHTAWERLKSGRLSWGALLQPAIRLAEEGYALDAYVAGYWAPGRVIDGGQIGERLARFPGSAAIYLANGHPPRPGEWLVQADYGRSLRLIAEQGPDAFYTGEIGRRLAEDFEQHGGFVTAGDLASYRPLWRQPVRGGYRGFAITSDQPPGSGVLVVAILQALDGWDLAALGWNTPAYIDRIARVFRLAFADRARYIADPAFVDVPVEFLASTAHAAELRRTVESDADRDAPPARQVGSTGTTHLSVLDGDGNAVAVTHTLGTCSGLVTPGLGFLYNNDVGALDPLPGRPNSLAPGKRAVNGGAPTMLLRDGQVALVIGSPAGARKVTAIVQAVANVIDHGMPIGQAVSVPRFHSEDVPWQIILEPAVPAEVQAGLEALGNTVLRDSYGARLAAIWRDPETGVVAGGADPRGGGGLAIVDYTKGA